MDEFSKAFSNYIDAKNKLIKKHVPQYIKINKNYFNTFINDYHKNNESFSFTSSSDGESRIRVRFLGSEFDVPLVIDDSVNTFQEVYKR